MNIALTQARLEGYRDFFANEENRGPIAIVAVVSEEIAGHFGLGIAVANERGYNPIPAGWAIFETMEAAEADADRANAQLGHDDLQAFKIVASTMGGKLYRTAA